MSIKVVVGRREFQCHSALATPIVNLDLLVEVVTSQSIRKYRLVEQVLRKKTWWRKESQLHLASPTQELSWVPPLTLRRIPGRRSTNLTGGV
jgi:hypothetical protein